MKKLIQSGDDEITRGDAVTLSMVAQLDDEPESIAGATDLTTLFMSPDGQRIAILNAAHTIIEAAGEDLGAFEVDLSAVETAKVMQGKRVHFCTTITNTDLESNTVRTFWGVVSVKKKPGE